MPFTFCATAGKTPAKSLLLIQEPSNSGAASGVVDRDNKYESARLFKALNEKPGFDRENGLSRAKPVCKVPRTYTHPQQLGSDPRRESA